MFSIFRQKMFSFYPVSCLKLFIREKKFLISRFHVRHFGDYTGKSYKMSRMIVNATHSENTTVFINTEFIA